MIKGKGYPYLAIRWYDFFVNVCSTLNLKDNGNKI